MTDNTSYTSKPEGKSAQLYAGVAKCEITASPAEYPLRDSLFAKALAIKNERCTVLILCIDAVAIGGICDIDDYFLPTLRRRIEKELGIPGSHLLVNASHTHPPGRILCDGEDLLQRAYASLKQAYSEMHPVMIGVGKAKDETLTVNRTLRLKDGQHWTLRHAYPGPEDHTVEDTGPHDPTIGILRIDHMDGRPLAVVYNFSCHLLFGDPLGSITANLPGIVSAIIEHNWGKDCMAFFLQGAAGDVIDMEFKNFEHPRDIEYPGTRLGLAILSELQNIQAGSNALNLISTTIDLPRRHDSRLRIQALRQEEQDLLRSLRFCSLNFRDFLTLYLKHKLNPDFPSAPSYRYLQAGKTEDSSLSDMDTFNQTQLSKYVENIHTMEKLTKLQDEIATFERHEKINRDSNSLTIQTEIQAIRIGDCALISAPLEILTEISLNIKRSSPFTDTLIAGFSNGYMHYGPPASDYDKRGYEVVECFLAPEWQRLFESKVAELLSML